MTERIPEPESSGLAQARVLEDNLYLQGFFIWQLLPNWLGWRHGPELIPIHRKGFPASPRLSPGEKDQLARDLSQRQAQPQRLRAGDCGNPEEAPQC